jgi:hypothetical protein
MCGKWGITGKQFLHGYPHLLLLLLVKNPHHVPHYNIAAWLLIFLIFPFYFEVEYYNFFFVLMIMVSFTSFHILEIKSFLISHPAFLNLIYIYIYIYIYLYDRIPLQHFMFQDEHQVFKLE